jgi:hypothetical protein
MPALSRGQPNNPATLNWFITVGGIPTDAYSVEYRIYDMTAGLPGTQIFPAVIGDWESASSTAGHFSVGSYYAFDHNTSDGWMPSIVETVGTHRIEWRWKISSAAPWQAGQEDFEVLVQSGGTSVDLYVNISDVRDEGVLLTTASDAKVLAYIETWQAFLERACRQWFIPKQIILKGDGTDSDTLHFGVPIIGIDYLKINGASTALDSTLYCVYNSRSYPDDRRNPRIKLIDQRDVDLYTSPFGSSLKFRKGRQNQEIKGIFGYTEEDGSVPKLIKRALLLLVVEKLTKPIYAGASGSNMAPPPIMGGIVEEQTDNHRVRYGGTSSTTGSIAERKPGLTGITQNLEVLDIIKLYKAPIGIATPANPSLS